MEASSPVDEHKDLFAEEMVKHVLYKVFGIYWEPDLMEVDSQKLPLKDYHTSCSLLGEAVTTGWRKFYAAVEVESRRIYKILNSSTSIENVHDCLKGVSNKIDLPKEFILFIVMAVFGELCLLITKSGAFQPDISIAVSGAKRFIVDEGLANNTELQMNSVQFMEFCGSDR